MGRVESLNFDLGVVNFDTMKLISFEKVPKSLGPSHSSAKRKGTQVLYQYLRSNMVEMRGVEPLSKASSEITSTSVVMHLRFPLGSAA